MKQIITDTLRGISIGDAVWFGVEFQCRHTLQQNMSYETFVNLYNWPNKEYIQPWYYSDDTEHSIAIAEALLDQKPLNKQLLLEKFRHEYLSDLKKKWHIRTGHWSIKHRYHDKEHIESIRNRQSNREDPGNAPVMRAVPLCFAPFDRQKKYSDISTDVTHPHPLGREASYLTIMAGNHFLHHDGDHDSLVEAMKKHMNDPSILEAIDNLPHPSKLTEDDYVTLHGEQPIPWVTWATVYGLPCAAHKTALNAIYILKHARSAFDALQMSISMGGDVDSLAAVTTGIMAGKYGLESLPQFMRDEVEGKERLEQLATKLHEKFYL